MFACLMQFSFSTAGVVARMIELLTFVCAWYVALFPGLPLVQFGTTEGEERLSAGDPSLCH